METRIATMIAELIEREGGYVNHPADKGGPTNMGITLATLSAYLKCKASIEEIKTLKPELAREIYYTRYFLAPRVDALPQEIQPLIFDMCVNHGAKKAIILLQQVVNQTGLVQLAEDGLCGPETQRAAMVAQREMGDYFCNALVDARINFYRQIVSHAPAQLVFLRGWERRAEGFRL